MNFKKILFLILIPLCFSCGCGSHRPEVVIHTRDNRDVRVFVEIAATPAQRNLGLMYREKLPSGDGMLFVFGREKKQVFTMKNTLIPLDMIFIDREKRIVGWVEDATPFRNARFLVDKPSMYVLEVNAFFCRKNRIEVGDRVVFKNIP